MIKLTPDRDLDVIKVRAGRVPMLIIRQKAAAVCMMARDRGEIKVAFQLPLYPMLSNIDTISSMNNHGKVWNTRRGRTSMW